MPMLTVEQALEQILATVDPAVPRETPLAEALGCRLAGDVISPVDSPPFDKSMMDGYAVRVADVTETDVALRVVDEVTAGRTADVPVGPGQAVRIMTGAPIPDGADAVVPIERTRRGEDDNEIRLEVTPPVQNRWNIIPRGESMRQGETVIETGQPIRAQETALLAEMGQAVVTVRRPPRIAVLATGDELVPIDQTPAPGQIRNSNALMLAAQVREAGAVPVLLDIARDDPQDLDEKIAAGLQCDVLCLSGGVSAGKLDLVPAALERAGVREVFHKVAMKPGKPIWFGATGEPGATGEGRSYIFGLPGNPVSSMVCFELFVRAAIRRFLGIEPAGPGILTAELTEPFEYDSDRPTWFPAHVEIREGRLRVHVVDWKGSSDLRSTVRANASVRLPSGHSTGAAGTTVDILPWGRINGM
jgi:molybdopterin molybdotransferase